MPDFCEVRSRPLLPDKDSPPCTSSLTPLEIGENPFIKSHNSLQSSLPLPLISYSPCVLSLYKPFVSIPCTMLSFSSGFDEIGAMFLEFAKDQDNPAGGSSSMGNSLASTSQPFVTLTPKRRVQSRLLELERYVHANGRILMSIPPGADKSISPHAVCFNRIKCWNSSPNLPQRVLSHSLRTRYVRQCWVDDRGYSKGLSWGPKLKAHKTANASSVTTSCSQSMVELQLRVELDKTRQAIEEQIRRQDMLVSEVE
ncbi:CACTA en-spm transposon protein [Cucumis melo var. makuwa]|uniref:CACTA en-spm transposon protein n=1 Tax=Cucumis melo var. makuwa TaxID=1194695 RepID=A0A5D3DJ02_CUCMM|nr:CACTA en-spm transposon protein [Cucumis melo var. makuwa]